MKNYLSIKKFIKNINKKLTKLVKKSLIPLLKNIFSQIQKIIKKALIWLKKNEKNNSKKFWIISISSLLFLINIPLFIWYLRIPKPARVKKEPNNSTYIFAASNNLYNVKLGDKETNQPNIKFSIDGNSISFVPEKGNEKTDFPKKEGNKVIFKNVYSNIDFVYQTLTNGIKEDIVINSPTNIKTFPFFLEFKGAKPRYLTNINSQLVFYDEKENYLFHFQKPYAFDASGNKTEKVSINIKKDTTTQKTVALISVDLNWLNSSERIYPITIDPTIVHDESSDFSSGTLNRVYDTGSGSSPSLESYYQELTSDINTTVLYHMNESANDSCSGNEDVCDSSSNVAHGTATGTTITDSMSSFEKARDFNGTSDYIYASGVDLPRDDFTYEAWINQDDLDAAQIWLMAPNDSGANEFFVATDTAGRIYVYTNASKRVTTNLTITTNEWHHIAVTRESGFIYVYIDGIRDDIVGVDSTPMDFETCGLLIGADADTGTCTGSLGNWFDGTIDELQISTYAKSPEEIKKDAQRRSYSIYTSDVLDLTLVRSWNSLAWTEEGVGTGDGETPYSTTSLIGQWDFNETSGTTADNEGSCGSSCDGTLTSFSNTSGQDVVTDSGWTSDNRRWGEGALMFDGSNDYVGVSNNTNLDFERTESFTLEAWFKSNEAVSSTQTILGKMTNSGDYRGYDLNLYNNELWFILSNTWDTNCIAVYVDNVQVDDRKWHHVVSTYNGNSSVTGVTLYIDGVEQSKTTYKNSLNATTVATTALTIGSRTGGAYFNGIIDTTRIYSRVLTSSEILSNYNNSSNIEFQTRVGSDNSPDDGSWDTWSPATGETQIDSMDNPLDWATPSASIYEGVPIATSSSSLKVEGNYSLKTEIGRPKIDNDTVLMWHMDETNGDLAGDDIFDETSNNNDGEITNTTLVDGYIGKGRSFTPGNTDYINTTLDGLDAVSTDVTVDFWAYIPNSAASTKNVVLHATPDDLSNRIAITFCWDDGKVYWDYGNYASNGRISTDFLAGWYDQWSHWAFVSQSGIGQKIYRNGVEIASDGTTSTFTKGTKTLNIGTDSTGTNYWSGKLDELRITNSVLTSREIAEAYRAARGHRISKTISSTDLSSSNKVPFYIASDRQGTFLEATIGESKYANYQPDSNTKGLWHFGEVSGLGAYFKDSSGNGNNGTPSLSGYFATFSSLGEGKIGNGINLDSVDDYIDVGNGATLQIGDNPQTISAWIKTGATVSTNYIYSSRDATNGELTIATNASGQLKVFIGSTVDLVGSTSINDASWHHVAVTYDGSELIGYVDGKKDCSDNSLTGTFNTTVNKRIGTRVGSSALALVGDIDEVRVDAVKRTADEIRQAYEIGLRTHPITIDFKASLGSGGRVDPDNLIDSTSDYSFHINTTTYGANDLGSNLYEGDKIIVKENYGGTEYISQGTVVSIISISNIVTVTVSSWDTGSTVPPGGFTINSTVFKWQREYFDISDSLSTHRNAVTDITLRITDASQGANVWLDDIKYDTGYLTNNSGSTITSSTQKQYFQYRVIFTSHNPSVSANLSEVTLDYDIEYVPNTPSLNEPTDGSTITTSLTPSLKTQTTDDNSDYLRYKIQLCEDESMTTNCQTFDQTSSQTGWSGQNTESSTAYTSGTEATYTPQSNLTSGTTYYWRSYAIDPGGSNTWSGTQSPVYSFTMGSMSQPTNLQTESLLNPTGITDLTPEFSAICNHTITGLIFDKYQIQVDDSPDFSSTVWNSGDSGTAMSNCTEGNRSSEISYAGSTLSTNGKLYYWKIRFWDETSQTSPWSTEHAFFVMDQENAPDRPTSCRIKEATDEISLTLLWDDNSSSETQYRIERNIDAGGFGLLTNAAANATNHEDSDVSANHTYQYRVRAEGSSNSEWCTTTTVDLSTGNFLFDGINLKGINIR